MANEQQWTRYDSSFKKCRLINGTYARGVMMRRKVHGEWQYRSLTPDEEVDENAEAAW